MNYGNDDERKVNLTEIMLFYAVLFLLLVCCGENNVILQITLYDILKSCANSYLLFVFNLRPKLTPNVKDT